MLFRWVSSLNCPKFIKICPLLVIPHTCPAYLNHALIVIFQRSITCFFFYFYICMFGFSKRNKFILYLKLDVLYSQCVEWYQHSPNYYHRDMLPWKWKLNDLPLLCHSRDFRSEFVCLLLFAEKRNENILEVKYPSKIQCKSNCFIQLKSEKVKSKNKCETGDNYCSFAFQIWMDSQWGNLSLRNTSLIGQPPIK